MLPQLFYQASLNRMKLTAVFEPAKEGGFTCFVEEVPAAISEGETIEEAKANLLDALKLVIKCQRELAEKNVSPRGRFCARQCAKKEAIGMTRQELAEKHPE
jgi:predicted RNase H-like HicB family nuclease